MAGGVTVYQDGEGEMIAEINVTPLVDVVLVLLVIFMVTAPLIAARGILIKTPETRSGEAVASPLQITLTRDKRLFVNGHEQKSYDAAKVELGRIALADPEVKAIIAADAEVPHGEVMKAIDSVEQAGIHKFALASKRPPEEPAR
jgi:biopolymer transport protein ExbD